MYFRILAIFLKLAADLEQGAAEVQNGLPVTITDIHENLFGHRVRIDVTVTPDTETPKPTPVPPAPLAAPSTETPKPASVSAWATTDTGK